MLKHGPTAVLYAVSDAVVDHYMEVAAELQVDLEELETEVFAPSGGGAPEHRVRGSTPSSGRCWSSAGPPARWRRRWAGWRGAGVPFVHEQSQPFFRDVSDHLTRVNEHVEGLDRLLSDILSAHLAQMGVRQNDDMRKISAWAAMAAVPTMVAGIYGMNFDHMPELHWVWAYPAVIGLMAGACLLLFRMFKRRGWL